MTPFSSALPVMREAEEDATRLAGDWRATSLSQSEPCTGTGTVWLALACNGHWHATTNLSPLSSSTPAHREANSVLCGAVHALKGRDELCCESVYMVACDGAVVWRGGLRMVVS